MALLDPLPDANPPAEEEEATGEQAGDVPGPTAGEPAGPAAGERTTVVSAVAVDGKTNETGVFRLLLRPLALTDVPVTADALHTVRSDLDWLVTRKKAQYLAIVKKNQPTVWTFLAGLTWADIPTGATTLDPGHGRDETRAIKTAAVSHLGFPHAVQAIRIHRWRPGRAGHQPARPSTGSPA